MLSDRICNLSKRVEKPEFRIERASSKLHIKNKFSTKVRERLYRYQHGLLSGIQTYFKIDMYDRAALSLVTRMVDDIEDIDGYEEGVTPVVFIGSMDASVGSVEYLSQLEVYGITNTPFNYNAYLWTYIWSFLNVDMNIVDMQADEGVLQLIDKKYPSKDSICLIDGVVYVRLSM